MRGARQPRDPQGGHDQHGIDYEPGRLEKERDQLQKNIANSKRQLSDDVFLGRAPAHVIESIRTKLAEYETQLGKVLASLNGA